MKGVKSVEVVFEGVDSVLEGDIYGREKNRYVKKLEKLLKIQKR